MSDESNELEGLDFSKGYLTVSTDEFHDVPSKKTMAQLNRNLNAFFKRRGMFVKNPFQASIAASVKEHKHRMAHEGQNR